jgi:class 3 adenylate cyclase/tetratricopeptide (TPR) repeat protein
VKCPKCQFENREGKKFCGRCGTKIESICPSCQSANPPDFQFCGDCGHRLEAEPSPKSQPLPPSDSARKHVTVLFSDMSGYTAMTEKLDPEETKEIMGKIFGEISKVVAKYGGFIEKFIGDAVMALFGVPTAHEDDPVRAIKASREIHDVVSSLSSQFEKKIGKALCMHTGICTGLVVTGEVNLEKGTHGVLGDTINTAARLSGLAKPGEVVISPDTHHQAEGYFNFEALELTTVKGKTESIKPYRVISAKDDPTKTHRLSGMRAELIGRKVEMAQLQEAVTNLKQGKGSIFSIVGDAGTGKSRLIEEFKTNLDPNNVQWREGHAYAYSQNIPYFPLVDLLSRAWQITEGDNPEQVKKKVEAGAGFLISDRSDLIPYLGSLYSLKYPEIENVSPEYWKAKLHEAVQLILSALTRRAQTIICIEDLHWADPSSVELLRNILSDFRYPAVFLCIYRPTFSLFTSHQASTIKSYQDIRLHDLSPTDAQSMVESLLKTDAAPGELKKFIRDRVEGNPFYLEEVINSLLETAILVSEDEQWKLTKPLIESNIPSTVQGVISARLDRLETETKRILQEASVIGRAFLYEILKRITELKEQIDRSLMGLERLDLIRTRSLQPELEYIFKHALTQEVVYNGLLKKERQNIHEKIGQVMEELFQNRLPEFYEALAYHFKQGHSNLKAIQYIRSAGQKSLLRYSVEEAHQYYREAYEILTSMPVVSDHEKSLLIDLLLDWAIIFHHRADVFGLYEVLQQNLYIAETIGDKAKLGMFYNWLGMSMERMEMLKESHDYLQKALQFGESEGDGKVAAYAHTWLSFVYHAEGFFDEALQHANYVLTSDICEDDRVLYFMTAASLAMTYWFRGEVRNVKDTGTCLLEYGRKKSDMRSVCYGYHFEGISYYVAGDFPAAITLGESALAVAPVPAIVAAVEVMLGAAYLADGQLEKAEKLLQDVVRIDATYKYGFIGSVAKGFSAVIAIMKGQLSEGVRVMEDLTKKWLEINSRYRYANGNNLLGHVYLQMVLGGGEKKKTLSFFAKNIGFLMKTMPFADKKAEEHFSEAIKVGREIGAKGVIAQASLGMGRLRMAKKRNDEARKYITDAIHLFEECEADGFLKQAREALAALG